MSFLFRQSCPSKINTDKKNFIKSNVFCLKVLTAMHDLQSGNNSLYNAGIRSKDIIRHMEENFDLDGDIKTQVHISLQQALSYGFITKDDGKYKLLGPMAKVMQEPHSSNERTNEINRVVKVFWSSRRLPSKYSKDASTTQKQVEISSSEESPRTEVTKTSAESAEEYPSSTDSPKKISDRRKRKRSIDHGMKNKNRRKTNRKGRLKPYNRKKRRGSSSCIPHSNVRKCKC